MAWKLTLEEINYFKASFYLFDTDNNGLLDEIELGNLMRSLGQNFSNEEIKKILPSLKDNEKYYLEFYEFLDLMAEHRVEKKDEGNLIKAFMYFDRDNTGYISYNEFKHALTSIAEKLNLDEIAKLEEEISYNGEERFMYKDLIKKMFK
jgi:Ca2+-binding EF-hand superfamily protein